MTLEAFIGHNEDAVLTVWITILFFNFFAGELLLAFRTNKAMRVEVLEREVHSFSNDGFIAAGASSTYLIDIALIAREVVVQLVKLPVSQPRLAHGALEALGMPGSAAVLEVANSGTDA